MRRDQRKRVGKRWYLVGAAVVILVAGASIFALLYGLQQFRRSLFVVVHEECSPNGRYCLELEIWQQGALGLDYAEVRLHRAGERRREFVAAGEIADLTTVRWTEDDRFELELRDQNRIWKDRKFQLVDDGGTLRVVEE